MTREWGKVKIKGDSDKDYSDKISEIEQRLKALGIRDLMRRHVETEMTFGRSQLFVDIKGQEESNRSAIADYRRITEEGLLERIQAN